MPCAHRPTPRPITPRAAPSPGASRWPAPGRGGRGRSPCDPGRSPSSPTPEEVPRRFRPDPLLVASPDMPTHPVFLCVEGRRCLVAGGDAAAARRARALRAAGATLTVVASRLAPEMASLLAEGGVEHLAR